MRPALSRILETSLYVADLERSKQFYLSTFGFDLFYEDERMAGLGVPGEGVLLLFRVGGSDHPSPTPGGVIPPHDGRGTQHLCFAIPLASLHDWVRHFDRHGVAIESRVVQTHGGTSLYFRDPDGHSLEVATPGLWPNY
ncbi:MAG: VOC family protein [Acetobacteraceae bacterium]|nr:VOC family protein [Acetobacteraceae bacterium]